jgi:hypothetical protein
MALVNALQSNSTETFHPHAGESAGRFMKIRSLWPFPVQGSQTTDQAESEPAQDEAGESVTPSSFVT